MSIQIRDVQRVMGGSDYYLKKAIDNDLGPATIDASLMVILEHGDAFVSDYPQWKTFGHQRVAFAAMQTLLVKKGFGGGKVDGLVGMLTEDALEEYDYFEINGAKRAPMRKDDNLLLQGLSTPMLQKAVPDAKLFPLKSEVEKHFGPPGAPACTAGKVNSPYPLRLAWDKSQVINRFSCHELVADNMQAVMGRVASHYSPTQIQAMGLDLFGGCYNFRKMRGGSNMSKHSWGIATDWNPEENRLRWGRERASMARPMFTTWWKLWEDAGWTSLGRKFNFDWMHVEAVRY